MDDMIVSTQWLAERLAAPDVAIVEAAPHLSSDGLHRSYDEYLAERIPGAIHFDIDDIADETNALAHMLPSPEKFSSRMRKAGIGDGNRIVVYDRQGIFYAPRVWWMFRTFGHTDVVVLDGGLPKWRDEAKPLSDGPPRRRLERHFTARMQSVLVRDMADILKLTESGAEQLADARSLERFAGREDEPREGMKRGHMPGAKSLHYALLLNPDNTMKTPGEIRAAFENAGLDIHKPMVTTCGSGVTAAILSLGACMAGGREPAVYDGSWTEWGADQNTPVVTGV